MVLQIVLAILELFVITIINFYWYVNNISNVNCPLADVCNSYFSLGEFSFQIKKLWDEF
jgi:hypothetical protein